MRTHRNYERRKTSAKEWTAWSRLSVPTVSAPLGLEGSFCILDEFAEVLEEEDVVKEDEKGVAGRSRRRSRGGGGDLTVNR